MSQSVALCRKSGLQVFPHSEAAQAGGGGGGGASGGSGGRSGAGSGGTEAPQIKKQSELTANAKL